MSDATIPSSPYSSALKTPSSGYDRPTDNRHALETSMKPSAAMEAHRDAIRRIVTSHRALNPRVFGSVLYGKDRDDSDLDILVDPLSNTTLFDIGAIQRELRELLGVEVDVLTPDDLPDRWRGRVLREAQPV